MINEIIDNNYNMKKISELRINKNGNYLVQSIIDYVWDKQNS
jgi:hypothetical protein